MLQLGGAGVRAEPRAVPQGRAARARARCVRDKKLYDSTAMTRCSSYSSVVLDARLYCTVVY